MTDGEELARGRVFYLSILVEHLVDAAHHVGKGVDALGERPQRWILPRGHVGAVVHGAAQEGGERPHRGERALQVEQLDFLHIGALGAHAGQRLAHVEEVFLVDVLFLLHEAAKLVGLGERALHVGIARHEGQAVHPLGSERRDAPPPEQGAHLVETYLVFKIFWVYHFMFFCLISSPPSLPKRARRGQKRAFPPSKRKYIKNPRRRQAARARRHGATGGRKPSSVRLLQGACLAVAGATRQGCGSVSASAAGVASMSPSCASMSGTSAGRSMARSEARACCTTASRSVSLRPPA